MCNFLEIVVLEVGIFLCVHTATWNSKNYPQSQVSHFIFAPIVTCSSASDCMYKRYQLCFFVSFLLITLVRITAMPNGHSWQPSRNALDSPGGVSRDPGITLFCPGISCFTESVHGTDIPLLCFSEQLSRELGQRQWVLA